METKKRSKQSFRKVHELKLLNCNIEYSINSNGMKVKYLSYNNGYNKLIKNTFNYFLEYHNILDLICTTTLFNIFVFHLMQKYNL